MSLHPDAGKPAPPSALTNVPRLVAAYYVYQPDPKERSQAVSFGTSGHRGSSFKTSFNEAHILATTQAICDYRKQHGINGPLFLGMDTHALSEPSFVTALEVLAGNGVPTMIQANGGYTPTPVISHAILVHNRGKASPQADGIVITPSHNPPEDGGFKYNPPHGGPADTVTTRWIEKKANELLEKDFSNIKRLPYRRALAGSWIHAFDFIGPYVRDLQNVVCMEPIRSCGIKIGIDPLGGSTVGFWEPISNHYGIRIEVVNPAVDHTFSFMCLDRDGKIRMDCSSPYAMAGLIHLKDRFDIAFGTDPDGDRHGIVTSSFGLLNPNHYLAAAVSYLLKNRPGWSSEGTIGKTLVSSSLIDRIAFHSGRRILEMPVGFKWFVDGLLSGSCLFAGEESAGASFLRQDGTVWTTDKDGIILGLLAAEICAITGKDPGEHYRILTELFGEPFYERIDSPATREQKAVLERLSPSQISASTLAGEKILAAHTQAPGNGAPIGGIKVVTENGWFAARPSGTEDVYKIYAESFKDQNHLAAIQEEAQAIINDAFRKAGVA